MWTMIPSRHGLTETFYEIYPNFDSFKSDYNSIGYPTETLTEANLNTLYNLLYAKHGTDNIVNMTQEQFKYRLFGIIFEYGPAWQARLNLQQKVRNLIDSDELREGTKTVHNHAYNPSTDPSTGSLDELEYINDQSTANYKKSKIEAYGDAWSMIVSDVTEQFLSQFDKLFITFVGGGLDYVNITE